MVTINDKHSTKTATRAPQTADKRSPDGALPVATKHEAVQGEGDYRAAREFNELEHAFVESGGVPAAARAASPKSEAERQEMLKAEQEGKRRSKGEDPAPTTARTDSGAPKNTATKADRQRG